MIKLEIANNTKREQVIVDGNKPITTILSESVTISLDGTNLRLDGVPLNVKDLGKSLIALGVKDDASAMLVSVVKTKSAA